MALTLLPVQPTVTDHETTELRGLGVSATAAAGS
jgi:hypothetical protein